MKKYTIFIILSLVIIPQITFAAWWNPLSWNVFNKQSPVTKTTSVPSVASTTTQLKEVQASIASKSSQAKIPPQKPSATKKSTPSDWVWTMTEKEFRAKMIEIIKDGTYTKDSINIWLDIWHKNSNGTYSNTAGSASGIYSNIDHNMIKSWLTEIPDKTIAQQESEWFKEAEQKGLKSFVYTLSSGEERYYIKENGKWTRKNTKAEVVEQCNGKNWDKCPTGKQFFCASSGGQCVNNEKMASTVDYSKNITTGSQIILSDEQKVKMMRLVTASSNYLDSISDIINIEVQGTSMFIGLENSDIQERDKIIRECDAEKVRWDETARQFVNMTANGLSARGITGDEFGRLVAEDQEKENVKVKGYYDHCVSWANFYSSAPEYINRLKDWLAQLEQYGRSVSSLRSKIKSASSLDQILSYQTQVDELDSNFTRERESADSFRRSITGDPKIFSDMQKRVQDQIDQSKKDRDYQSITCTPGALSSYTCVSSDYRSSFTCSSGVLGSITCSKNR